MAKAKNKVLSGLYEGSEILRLPVRTSFLGELFFVVKINKVIVNEANITSIEVIDKDTSKDNSSSLARGIVGGALLGGAGLFAGASMGSIGSINTLCITWKDGQKSLVEVDSEIFKILNTIHWNVQNHIDTTEKYKKAEKCNKQVKKGCLTIMAVYIALLVIGGIIAAISTLWHNLFL